MSPRCGCQDSCSCLIVAGPGVTVEGIGTLERPYEIASESGTMEGRLAFDDSGGVDFTAIGAGSTTSPMVVSASAALATLSDVPPDPPAEGQVLVWRTDHWEYEDQSGGGGTGLPAGGTDGQVLTKQSATDGDALWESLPAAPAVPSISRRKDTPQTLTTASTYYTITWEALERPDVGITYSGGVFTFTEAGLYQVNVTQHFSPITANPQFRLAFTVNGLVYLYQVGGGVSSTLSQSVSLARVWRFEVGDTLAIQAYSTNANQAAYGGASRYSVIDITKIAP